RVGPELAGAHGVRSAHQLRAADDRDGRRRDPDAVVHGAPRGCLRRDLPRGAPAGGIQDHPARARRPLGPETALLRWGPRDGPQAPRRSERPGGAVALLYDGSVALLIWRRGAPLSAGA